MTIEYIQELGCKQSWLIQFKTIDLKDMLNKILFRDKKELTNEIILKDIEPFEHQWICEEDWWYGSTNTYINAMYGYDINVCHNEETGNIEAIVYDLVPSKEDNGHLEISKEVLFKFEIAREPTYWDRGQIVTPKALEDGSPFIIGKNYIITDKSYRTTDTETRRVYTIANRIDFKYSCHEIGAYFKKGKTNDN